MSIPRRAEADDSPPLKLRSESSADASPALREPKLFVSYRHEDAGWGAARLAEQLRTTFGPNSVFRDESSIDPGRDFRDAVLRGVADSDVVLAVIGKTWTAELKKRSKKAGETDWVRKEIETAFQEEVDVIPVVLFPATMPKAGELPPSLAPLAYLKGVTIYPGDDFDNGFAKLVRGIVNRLPPEALAHYHDATAAQPAPRSAFDLRHPAILFGLVAVTACLLLAVAASAFYGSEGSTPEKNFEIADDDPLMLEVDLERTENRIREQPARALRESDLPTQEVPSLGLPDYSSFEIRHDDRIWDLRAFRPELLTEESRYVSAMVYERTVQLIKIDDANEIRFEHRTSGSDIVFDVASPLTPASVLESSQRVTTGQFRMKVEHLCFDLSEYERNVPITLHYRATFWDAPDDSRWIGTVGYPGCLRVRVFAFAEEPGFFEKLERRVTWTTHRSEHEPTEAGVLRINDDRSGFVWDIAEPEGQRVYMAFF